MLVTRSFGRQGNGGSRASVEQGGRKKSTSRMEGEKLLVKLLFGIGHPALLSGLLTGFLDEGLFYLAGAIAPGMPDEGENIGDVLI